MDLKITHDLIDLITSLDKNNIKAKVEILIKPLRTLSCIWRPVKVKFNLVDNS